MEKTHKHRRLLGALPLLLGLLLSEEISAQGFIIPQIHHSAPRLIKHVVDVDIDNQVARVNVVQVFRNPSNRAIEGNYYFPLPEGAGVSDFEMIVDGKVMRGELLEKGRARHIYEDIVRRQIDPALLEYIDHNLFGASIFPIPPGGQRTIVLEYTALLEQDGGLVRFVCPLRGEAAAGRQGPAFRPAAEDKYPDGWNERSSLDQAITVELRSAVSLRNIYSPSHDVEIVKENDRYAKISFEGEREGTSSFILYYSFSEKDFGLNLLTYRSAENEDGYFMLLLSPKHDFAEAEISDKDIILILDTSGSMEGEKMAQAKEALEYCIRRLNVGDRFNLIAFSSEVRRFQETLVDAAQYRRDALKYIENLEARGGTNINDALQDALGMSMDSERPTSIVFLTDGLPTAGETDAETIVQNVDGTNRNDVRVFTFGVGYDVNTLLLDRIAEQSRSVSDYIEPDEDIEETVSKFFDKISYPVLTDLVLDYGGLKVDDAYPRRLPDLFLGSQLTVVGRYSRERETQLSLQGEVNGRKRTFRYRADFTGKGGADFLPHLWATRKIGTLMDEIRLHGEDSELVEEVVRLSQEYGVMSPYTSYLVQEEETLTDRAAPVALRARRGGGSGRMNAMAAPMVSGEAAVQMSKVSREMKEAVAASSTASVKHVGSRTFLLKDGMWVDSEYTDEKTLDIEYGSQAYIDLMLMYPEMGKFAALGERVLFKSKNRYVKISDKGKASMSQDEMRRYFG